MRASSLVLLAVFIASSFSGCFGDDAGSKSASTSAATGTTSATSTTGTGGTGGNDSDQAPNASIAVLVDGAPVEATNGSYPVTPGTNVTLDGNASSDPDGGDLSFAWDLGDGTTGENATITHAFAAGGYTVTLVVKDDEGSTATATVPLNVTGSAGGAAYFFDDADTPAAWTFTKQTVVIFYFNPLPGTNETIDEPNPNSEGWHASSKQKLSGSKSWSFVDETTGTYHDMEKVSMVSPKIDLKSATGANLSFSIKGSAEATSGEQLYVQVSSDAGATYTNVYTTDAIIADWSLKYFDISSHVGKEIQLRILFESDTSCSGDSDLPELCGAHEDYKGYYIDDIIVAPL